jgi:hypothetical protein
MKTFKEYLEESEEKDFDILEEDAAVVGTILGKILGIATIGLLSAYGGSLLVLAGAKGYKGLKGIWENIKATMKGEKVKKIDFRSFFKKTKSNSLVKQELNKANQKKKKYYEELKGVYLAIEKKDFVETKEKFAALAPQFRNLPEIKQIIINEITKSLGEPPLWPPSPGNITYKAVRNVLGLAEAKAAASAVRYHTNKTIEESDEF